MAGLKASCNEFSISVGDELVVSQDNMVLPYLSRDVYSEFEGCPAAVKEIIVNELTRYFNFTIFCILYFVKVTKVKLG